MAPSSAEIEYFIEVCHVLNFSRAAERLGLSQPSLSLAMQRLEKNIGTALFVRHKHGVSLTQAGRHLLVHAKELVNFWEKTKAKALSSHKEIKGFFTLGCYPSIANCLVAKFLPQLLSNYPMLEIQLKHDLSRKLNEELVKMSIDIGIVVNPFSHPDLVIRQLFCDDVTFWISRDYSILQDMTHKDKVIVCDPDLLQTQSLLKSYKNKGLTFNRMLTTSSLEVAANLAVTGTGIAILPHSIAQNIGKDQLVAIPDAPVYSDKICLVYRHENRNIEAIQEIIKAIKKFSQR